jgi:hypothetical protein
MANIIVATALQTCLWTTQIIGTIWKNDAATASFKMKTMILRTLLSQLGNSARQDDALSMHACDLRFGAFWDRCFNGFGLLVNSLASSSSKPGPAGVKIGNARHPTKQLVRFDIPRKSWRMQSLLAKIFRM